MSTEDKLRPGILLTLEEYDELELKLKQAYAMVDLLDCSFHDGDTQPGNQEWVTTMIFAHLQEVVELWDRGSKRESEARKQAA